MTKELSLLDGQLTAIPLTDPDDASLIGPQWIHSAITVPSHINDDGAIWQRVAQCRETNEWESWFLDLLNTTELNMYVGRVLVGAGSDVALVVNGYLAIDGFFDSEGEEGDEQLHLEDMHESICTFVGVLALGLHEGTGTLPTTKVRIGRDAFLVEPQ